MATMKCRSRKCSSRTSQSSARQTPARRFRIFCSRSVVAAVLILAFSTSGFGQMSARGLGMGGAFTALARGVQAQFWNPANLGAPDNPRFSMTFFSIEAGLWNNSFTKGMYDRYNGRHWSSQDIQDILSAIPDNGFRMDAETAFNFFSFSTGPFAFCWGMRGGSYLRLDRTFFSLALEGNRMGETYTFDNIGGQGLAVGVFGFSYGRQIVVPYTEWFSVGATLHGFIAGPYMNVDRVQASISFRDYWMDLDAEFAISDNLNAAGVDLWDDDTEDSKGGWPLRLGWGLDLGAAARLSPKWSAGLSLSNLFGHIPWAKAGRTGKGYVRADSLTVISDDDDEDAILDSTWSIPAGRISSKLPTIIRLGAAYQEGVYLLTADFRQDFVNGVFASTRPQLAVGTEWSKISWLPLRMGVVIGGRNGFGTSFGFGIRPGGFVFDVAVMNCGFFTPGLSKGMVVALDLGIELQKRQSQPIRVMDIK